MEGEGGEADPSVGTRIDDTRASAPSSPFAGISSIRRAPRSQVIHAFHEQPARGLL
jgi:hypothetical protein